jgi:hypothetical protein
MIDGILTKTTFASMIERMVHEQKMTYMEAVLHFCEERHIDPLDVGKLISPAIKAKIEAEAQGKNLLPKTNSLSKFL